MCLVVVKARNCFYPCYDARRPVDDPYGGAGNRSVRSVRKRRKPPAVKRRKAAVDAVNLQ